MLVAESLDQFWPSLRYSEGVAECEVARPSLRMTVVGTKRTNGAGLLMSVVRGRPEVAGRRPK